MDLTIYEHLKQTVKPIYLTVRSDETRIRCPHCGDSQKSRQSAHLYIKNQPPYPYYCQRCSTSGKVDDKFLRLLNIADHDLSKYIRESFHEYSKTLNKKYGGAILSYKYKEKELDFLPAQYTELEEAKLRYLESRMGFPLDEDLLTKFSIILNLNDFYAKNKISTQGYPRSKYDMLYKLHEDYVMFMLYDKGMINARHMNPPDKKSKFYKLRLYEDLGNEESKRFYAIRTDLDLASRVVDIHIAEGIFDIISVYHNIHKRKEDTSTLYIANNGKGYLFVLNYLQSIGILNCNIYIYSDSDVDLKQLSKRLKYSMLAKMNGVTVYYNDYHKQDPSIKDFGVEADKIILSEPYKLNLHT